MSEDNSDSPRSPLEDFIRPPAPSTTGPSAATPPPPMPELFTIPSATIQRWVAIPAEAAIQVPLTRQEIDHLYFALDHSLTAQTMMLQTLSSYTNGDVETANKHFWEASRRLIEANNRLRQFMNGVMAAATTQP